MHVQVAAVPMKRSQPSFEQDDEQLIIGNGYDHNWVLNKEEGALAARVFESHSGITMEVHTTEPGIQFYSGNFSSSY